jgi:sugar lactone lactonase YvrE
MPVHFRCRLTSLVFATLAMCFAPSSWAQYAPFAGGGPPNGAAATSIALSTVYDVVADGSGNLYVSAGAQNRVYQVTPNGIVTTVAGNGLAGFSGDGGQGTNAELNSPRGIAIDGAGNLYIADTGNERIRKLTGGVITTVAGNGVFGGPSGDGGPATSASFGSPAGVAVDSAGNLYIADTSKCLVRKVAQGLITTVAGNGTCGFSGDGVSATSAELNFPEGLAVDSAGSLYIADEANCRLRKIAGGFITTVAGNGACGFSGDGGTATSAELAFPEGVTVDSAGNYYIADTNNNRVRKVTGGVITTVAGNGVFGPLGDGGAATSGELSFPTGVAVDSAGNLYIADSDNYRLRKVTNGSISTVAGNGSLDYSGDNGPATSAQINAGGIALDSLGNLYIADSGDYRVRKVTGGVITTAVGNGVSGYAGDTLAATNAEISFVQGIAVDGAGNLYIADAGNQRIRKVAAGVITTVAGNGIDGYSGDGGPATNAELASPQGIAADSSGNIYITDPTNNRIRKISGGVITLAAGGGPPNGVAASTISLATPTDAAVDSAGNVYVPSPSENRVYMIAPNGSITTVAGNGTAGYSGDGGLAASAQLNGPKGVAIDSSTPPNVYIADTDNNRVRKVSGGVITTVAGNGTSGFSGDGGSATNAELSFPEAIAVDNAGNLYIADTDNNRVRKVSGGVISTVAGNGTAGYSGDGGVATSAQLSLPEGVAVDSVGNLYIADSLNSRIRRVSAGNITTFAGNGSSGFSGDGGPAGSAALAQPDGVTVDSAGNLYIADTENSRIRKVVAGVITTVAGNGQTGYSGDGGAATSASLAFPQGLAVDSAGNLYIADTNNQRLRKVAGGLISTIGGNGFTLYSGDGGQATNAQLDSPSAIAVDNSGNLYISDSLNNRVRVVSPGGTITTFAGGGGQLGDGGPPTSASLNNPQGIATDSAGNVYIRDTGDGLLRKVSGGVITTIAAIATTAGNGTVGFSNDGGVAVDSSFNVYDSEPSSNIVYKFATPGTPWHNDSPVTVGVKFRSSVTGAVTGIRFYKGLGNTGTHIGQLYTGSGTLMASATFTGETDSGWQLVTFPAPVAIQANTTYVAAYWSTSGFAYDSGYFTNKGTNEPPVQLLQAGVDGPNGLYAYGSSPQFPASSFGNANYWVDVVLASVPALVQPPCQCIWPTNPTPGTQWHNDSPATLGLKFTSTASGSITGVRFYQAAGNAGTTVVGQLYSYNSANGTGALLATTGATTFTGVAPGWQTLTFSAPVAIQANTTYVAAYWSSAGFPYDSGYFTSNGVSSPPLQALQSGTNGPNGLYAYGSSPQFPASSFGNANYWVDVVYSPSGSAPCQCIWPTNPTPGTPWHTDSPATLGLKFTSTTSGSITGIRFYQAAGNTGATVVGQLYSYNSATGSGTLLGTTAQTTFTGTTAGWQTLALVAPVAIQANTTYVAAYWSSSGFPYDSGYFTNNGVSSPPLQALQSGTNGPNGLYEYGNSPQFPAFSFGSANYWVDVVFSTVIPSVSSIWQPTTTPGTPWQNDSPVTVGVKFRSDQSGSIAGIKFYKGQGNNGTHIGLLYSYASGSDTGTLLATATFTGETSSGWQTVDFANSVSIQANTTYVAAIWTNSGYAYDANYFANNGVDNSFLHALRSGVDGPNGVYKYGSTPIFPAFSFGSANYWVDIVFQ